MGVGGYTLSTEPRQSPVSSRSLLRALPGRELESRLLGDLVSGVGGSVADLLRPSVFPGGEAERKEKDYDNRKPAERGSGSNI